MVDKITVPAIRNKKRTGEKITALTAYDYCFARILDQAGIDILLVGDSLACVIQGQDSTLPVTLEEMIYHTRAVVRGRKQALVVADMPFLSYQVNVEEAKRNAGRLLQEGGAEAVKLEGGVGVVKTIEAIVKMGVPVMGHVGLTPQSIHQFGGYKIQGREKEQWDAIMADALAVEAGGAFSVVLEGIPAELAGEITAGLQIPTIGIGAGVKCDGQILVIHDILGLFDKFAPKFVKRYAEIGTAVSEAAKHFIAEVQAGTFPDEEHSFR
ncbi:MAG: 3-methyl-2-oxobutanoate hydroxymethyltransferase [Deltaproteobacteria bacterium]|nr:3-methyl-2-oxobutanoate hydroxymethyltransferase [Deltaproteobacteria bacterium]